MFTIFTVIFGVMLAAAALDTLLQRRKAESDYAVCTINRKKGDR